MVLDSWSQTVYTSEKYIQLILNLFLRKYLQSNHETITKLEECTKIPLDLSLCISNYFFCFVNLKLIVMNENNNIFVSD